MKTQTTIRVDEVNYNLAKDILHQLGLNYSQTIGIFNNMIVMNQGLPFEVKIPNHETPQKKALDELEAKEGKSFQKSGSIFNQKNH